MGKNRVKYCPRNGCGMPNGAATPCPVICKSCGYGSYSRPHILINFDRLCPKCKKCISCGRIAKKDYLNE